MRVLMGRKPQLKGDKDDLEFGFSVAHQAEAGSFGRDTGFALHGSVVLCSTNASGTSC
jgi:hypothetical protein